MHSNDNITFILQDLRDHLIKLGLTDLFGEQRDLGGIMFDCPQIEEVRTQCH